MRPRTPAAPNLTSRCEAAPLEVVEVAADEVWEPEPLLVEALVVTVEVPVETGEPLLTVVVTAVVVEPLGSEALVEVLPPGVELSATVVPAVLVALRQLLFVPAMTVTGEEYCSCPWLSRIWSVK